MHSSLDGVPQAVQPLTVDEVYLANVREAVRVEEEKLSTAKTQTAKFEDLTGEIKELDEHLSSIEASIDAANEEKAGIDKLTVSAKAARDDAFRQRDDAIVELEACKKAVVDTSAEVDKKKMELDRVNASISSALDLYSQNKAVKDAKLEEIDRDIHAAYVALGDVKADIAQKEKEYNDLDGRLIQVQDDIHVAERERDEITEETKILRADAQTIIDAAQKKADEILAGVAEANRAALADLDRVKVEAEAVVLSTSKTIEDAEMVKQQAADREANVESIKQNVMIEISKEIRNAQVQKGNVVIQDYLEKLQNV